MWRNNHNHGGVVAMNDNYNWAFGQILAVVMIAATLNEVVHCVLGQIDIKLRTHSKVIEVEGASEAASQHSEGHTYPPRRLPASGYVSAPERAYGSTSPSPRAADQPIGSLQ
jgi:hypothetical protein